MGPVRTPREWLDWRPSAFYRLRPGSRSALVPLRRLGDTPAYLASDLTDV
jgi:hypothetical protein